MIISHAHRFVFVKSRKTGSTSVEIALAPHAGADGVVTPITPRDERMRLDRGGVCRNYAHHRATEERYRKALQSEDVTGLPDYVTRDLRFFNHMSLGRILEACPAAGSYRILSIERHPYEKAVSVSNFRIGYDHYAAGQDLAATIDGIRARVASLIDSGDMRKIRNWDLYTLDGKPRFTHMLQHAALQSDYDAAVAQLGIPAPSGPLPVAKLGQRDRSIAARDLLTAAQRTFLQTLCAEEFAYFGYER